MTLDPSPPALSPHAWPWHPGCDVAAAWQAWAGEASVWLQEQGADARDALVTVPVGALLAPARQAWAQAVGGWMPRIETIASLAEAHRWAKPTPVFGEQAQEAFGSALSLDAIEDRLQAGRSLGRQAWAKQWAARDRRGFEFAVDQVVDASHVWFRALQASVPDAREALLEHWRTCLAEQGASGPGGRERLLLAWALEWAAASAEGGMGMDVVFAQRPSAWLTLTVGSTWLPGSEGALMLAAVTAAQAEGVPCRWWSAEVARASDDSAAPCMEVTACSDLLEEARQSAAQVLVLAAERDPNGAPVGLLALDRSVVRHVRALLDGSGLSIADETGWLLSTTRAAAACTRLLTASNPRASTDELLDWLKSGWVRQASSQDLFAEQASDLSDSIGMLERWCRRQGLIAAWSMLTELDGSQAADEPGGFAHQRMPDEARVLWAWARQALKPLQLLWEGHRSTLQQWLQALRQALVQSGAEAALLADPAGALLWDTLRLPMLDGGAPDAAPVVGIVGLPESHRVTRMDGASFQRWLSDMLEAVTFRPQADASRPDVVITTMARAALRPFHAVVIPGADEKQLGALGSPSGWLGVRMREAMGLVTPMLARQAQWEAFRLVATRPRLHALHRVAEGSEPLDASPWLARWAHHDGCSTQAGRDVRPLVARPARPTLPPQPRLGEHGIGLPARLSATHFEVLRQCPYRFFAQVVLRLQTQDELEEGLARSDQGSWLHETLRRFHEARDNRIAMASPQTDIELWVESARTVARAMGLLSEGTRPHFRPHEMALPDLARAYVGWLGKHEKDGWRVKACEVERELLVDFGDQAQGLALRLVGQLDRVDVRHQGDGSTQAMVIDYKTGSAVPLKQKVKAGAEDTQLAFYAALGAGEWGDSLEAAYVHIDARKVETLPHADVEQSAEQLIEQLASDWVRLHRGAPLLALGDGAACEHCAMRGLCRRDHWQASAQEEA